MTALRRTAVLFVLALTPALTGCGATVARARVVGAETAVSAARRADAEKKAVYEFTSALIYLEKAREEEAFGRFGNAIEYGGLSERLAEKAKLAASTAEAEASPEQ